MEGKLSCPNCNSRDFTSEQVESTIEKRECKNCGRRFDVEFANGIEDIVKRYY
ncbi:MAG: hypothetical protein PWP31_1988 [Clostridia bacterium]|nr:hypothetical protein [Clostridia bacterium]